MEAQNEPTETEPSTDWEHRALYDRVRDAINALPSYFESDISIRGVDAEDLFSLNSLLGTAIENSVVETLNNIRSVWDPNGEYDDCSFIRQPQTFPDVLFVRHSGGDIIPIMGIELKSWYLLAKEKEPSGRYKVTPAACAPQDLFVVFTWSLNDVISGKPELHQPYVASAKYASEYVDYYWQVLRDTDKNRSINRPSGVGPYPASKVDKIQDRPEEPAGDNYGRFSRSGMMDEYVKNMLRKKLYGITSKRWIKFLTDG
jgi:hypothetical protein